MTGFVFIFIIKVDKFRYPAIKVYNNLNSQDIFNDITSD